jgi:hypothetical protein
MYYSIIKELKEKGINSSQNFNSLIMTLLTNLESKLLYHLMDELLIFLAENINSKNNFLEYEFKAGVKILLDHGKWKHLFNVIFIYLEKKETVDEQFILSIMTAIFSSKNHHYNERCFEIIRIAIKKNSQLSNTFWELCFDKYSLVNVNTESNSQFFTYLLKNYPENNFFNTKLFTNIIHCFMKPISILYIFKLLREKFDNFVNKNSNTQSNNSYFFECVFNLFIEEMATTYENIDHIAEEIFSEIIQMNLKIKENNLIKYFEKLVKFNIPMECLKRNLITGGKYLTPKILERIIDIFYKVIFFL